MWTVKRSQLLLASFLFSYCRKDPSESKVSKKHPDEAARERLASHGCENAYLAVAVTRGGCVVQV